MWSPQKIKSIGTQGMGGSWAGGDRKDSLGEEVVQSALKGRQQKGEDLRGGSLESTAPTAPEGSEGDGRPRERARPGRETQRAGHSLGASATRRAWSVTGARPPRAEQAKREVPAHSRWLWLVSVVRPALSWFPSSVLVQKVTPAPLQPGFPNHNYASRKHQWE